MCIVYQVLDSVKIPPTSNAFPRALPPFAGHGVWSWSLPATAVPPPQAAAAAPAQLPGPGDQAAGKGYRGAGREVEAWHRGLPEGAQGT